MIYFFTLSTYFKIQVAASELGAEDVVGALRRTADAVSETVVSVATPAWETTAEVSSKLAEDLRPAFEQVIYSIAEFMDLESYFSFF